MGRFLCRLGFHKWFIMPTGTTILQWCDRCSKRETHDRVVWK
jgi:hypothetical protein